MNITLILILTFLIGFIFEYFATLLFSYKIASVSKSRWQEAAISGSIATLLWVILSTLLAFVTAGGTGEVYVWAIFVGALFIAIGNYLGTISVKYIEIKRGSRSLATTNTKKRLSLNITPTNSGDDNFMKAIEKSDRNSKRAMDKYNKAQNESYGKSKSTYATTKPPIPEKPNAYINKIWYTKIKKSDHISWTSVPKMKDWLIHIENTSWSKIDPIFYYQARKIRREIYTDNPNFKTWKEKLVEKYNK